MKRFILLSWLLAMHLSATAAKSQTAAPTLMTQPVSLASAYGGTAIFNVIAQGATPLSYQWYKDGLPLNNDAAGIRDVNTMTLTIEPVQPGHSGDYFVVVSNAFGSGTSQVAHLSLLPDVAVKMVSTYLPISGMSACGLAVMGNYAYLVGGLSGLQVIDISDPANPQRVGGYDTSGFANGVVVMSNRAYVADGGAGLQVIDISMPTNPQRLGGYDTTGSAYSMAVTGDYALVADDSAGLQVIDVSNPANLRRVGGYASSSAADVVVSGNYAYLLDRFAGLQVINVSDPANPQRVGQYDTSGFANGISVTGNYAYVADGGAGLQVIDIRNPASPQRVSGLGIGGYATGIAVLGNMAFVAAGTAGLQVIDIGDPANPQRVGRYAGGEPDKVVTQGNYAYVADASRGLVVIQFSGLSPALVQQPTNQIVFGGDRVVLSGWASGTPPLSYQWLFNGSILPGQTNATFLIPTITSAQTGLYSLSASNAWGSITSDSARISLAIPFEEALEASNLVWRTGGASPWFTIVDETHDGVAAARTGAIENYQESWLETTAVGPGSLQFWWKVSLESGLNYLQFLVDGAIMKSISGEVSWSNETYELGPGNHVLRWSYKKDLFVQLGQDQGWLDQVSFVPVPPSSAPWIVADPQNVRGAYGGTAVFNVIAQGSTNLSYQWYKDGLALSSDTAGISGANTMALTVGPVWLSHIGDYFVIVSNLYGSVTSQVARLSLLPDAPVKRTGAWATSAYDKPNGIAVMGNYAYVAGWFAGLQVIDISNPASPQRVSSYDTSGIAFGVTVMGNYAYVADGDAGLQIIDISNPLSPQRLGGYNTRGNALGVTVMGNYAYVADGDTGLLVIDITNPATPQCIAEYDTSSYAYGVAALGNYACVAGGAAGFQVINISNPASPQRLGSYPTTRNAKGVAVIGNYAYVADGGAGLQVIDLRNPTNPQGVGGYATNGNAKGVMVRGNYAYVADGDAGLQVIDISNPASPQRVGADAYGFANGVAVQGNYAYVADERDGLVVLQISGLAPVMIQQPTNQTVSVKDHTVLSGWASGSPPLSYQWSLNGTNLPGQTNVTLLIPSMTLDQAGLYSLTASNAWGGITSNPVRISMSIPVEEALDASSLVWRTGGTALWLGFMDETHDGIDAGRSGTIGNLAESWVETTIARPGSLTFWWKVSSQAGLDYLQLVVDGVVVKSISGEINWTMESYAVSPGDHVVRWSYKKNAWGESGQDAGWLDQVTFVPMPLPSIIAQPVNVASVYGGTAVLNVMAQGPPPLSYQWYKDGLVINNDAGGLSGSKTNTLTMGPVQPIHGGEYYVVVSNLAGSVTSQVARLILLADVSFKQVGSWASGLPGQAQAVAVQGNYVYLADYDAGLQVIDIGNPANPQRISGYATTGHARGVAVIGNYAYVADESAGLQVIEISNPANPQRVGGYDTVGDANGVAVLGNYAYVADGEAGLQVIDISNQLSPQRMGGCDTSGYARGVATQGNYAYVADDSAGLQVIDISNPANPQRVGGYDTSGTAYTVSVLGNYAYVADGIAGLQVIDVSNPANPRRVGGYDTTGIAFDAAVLGATVYVADGGDGMQVIDISYPANPQRVGGYDTKGSANGITVLGDTAYVANGDAGLAVLQFSGLPPIMVQPPANQTVAPGDQVVLGEWASGTSPLFYQWYFNGTSLPGQTNATFRIPSMTTDQAGLYLLTASNAWGSITSNPARLSLAIPLDTGLDTTNLVWLTGGSAPWIGITDETHDGMGAALSGIIGINQESWLQTTVSGPGSLRFWWKVSSKAGFDFLQLLVDGLVVKSIAGEFNWTPERYELSSGNHVLRWTYKKTYPSQRGQDRGWLDQVSYALVPPDSAPWIAAEPQSVTSAYGGAAMFKILAQGSGTLSYLWYKDGLAMSNDLVGISGTKTVTLTVGPVQPVLCGDYYVVVSNSYGSATSHVAQLSLVPDVPVQISGSWPAYPRGPFNGVAVLGNYAYVAENYTGLQVIDISNPASPQRLGNCVIAGDIMAVAVLGTTAYVACGYEGLQVIDISNPANPRRMGSYASSDAEALAVWGDYVYVADGSSGLLVIDISNPASPQRVGGYDTSGHAYGVTLLGNYAYVADGLAGLQIIDISNPVNPQRMNGVDTFGNTVGVAVMGDYAYVADYNTGLQVIDIHNPASPQRMGGYDTSGNAYGVMVLGNYAYVADGNSGLQVIDVSNPANPRRASRFATSGIAYGLTVLGNNAYVAEYSGLQVIDIRNPASPQLIGELDSSGTAEDVVVVGNYAYVADGEAGLQVIDISNPLKPQRVTKVDTSGNANRLAVLGNYAYVADGVAGLQVFDIRDPLNPRRVSGYDTSGSANGIALAGNYAYVADYDAGLIIIDISIPANPRLVGGYANGTANGVAVMGNYAYVTDASFGLRMIDISNPARPLLVGQFAMSGNATAVTVMGNYAYVANANGGLQVIDVRNPANPLLVGSNRYASSANACGISVTGNFAFVADGSAGLQVIDISNPTSPQRVGGYDTGGYVNGVTVMGNTVYLADGRDGLTILQLSGTKPVVVQQPTDQLVNAGDRVIQSGWASGSPPLAYQWNFNGAGILGQTNATYIISSMTTDHAGLYSLAVSNPWGGVTSAPVRLSLAVPLVEALDATNLVWRTSSDAPWLGITDVTYDSQDAAHCGVPGNDQYSWVETTVVGPGILSFWWKVASEARNNYLQFRIDGGITKSISGDLNWSYESYGLSPGNHVLRWSYWKTSTGPMDHGLGWLDQVNYVPMTSNSAPWIAREPIDITSTYGGTAVLKLTAQGNPPLSYQWYKNGLMLSNDCEGIRGVQSYILNVGPFQPDHIGDYFIVVSNSMGSVTSQVARLSLVAEVPVKLLGIWTNSPTGEAHGLAIIDNLAYMADGNLGLQVIDVSNPSGPQRVGAYDTRGYANDAAMMGNYAYVADGLAGLQVIDIRDPANPQRVGGYVTSKPAVGIAVKGEYAFVAAGEAGLQIIDIRNPANPQSVGECDTYGAALTLEIMRNYAYVADKTDGLQVIDISNPTNPLRVGGCDTSGLANRIAVQGDYAYLADDYNGLQIIDIRNPANPQRVSGYNTGGYAYGVAVMGNYAYLTYGNFGLQVIDISNPTHSQRIGGYDTVGSAFDVAVVGNYAYVADGTAGLTVLQISGISPEMVQQPTNQTVNAGDRVVLSGWASGTPPLVYQWCYNGAYLAGQTNATFTIPSMAANQIGWYSLAINNTWGSITSAVAQVMMNGASELLKVTQVESKPEGMSLQFMTVLGKIHRVQRNDNFPSGPWQDVSDDLPGNGEILQFLDTGTLTLKKGFYRIQAR